MSNDNITQLRNKLISLSPIKMYSGQKPDIIGDEKQKSLSRSPQKESIKQYMHKRTYTSFAGNKEEDKLTLPKINIKNNPENFEPKKKLNIKGIKSDEKKDNEIEEEKKENFGLEQKKSLKERQKSHSKNPSVLSSIEDKPLGAHEENDKNLNYRCGAEPINQKIDRSKTSKNKNEFSLISPCKNILFKNLSILIKKIHSEKKGTEIGLAMNMDDNFDDIFRKDVNIQFINPDNLLIFRIYPTR